MGLLEKLGLAKKKSFPEEKLEAALKERDEKARAKAVRETLKAPAGSIDAETLLSIIAKDSSPAVRVAAANALFRRLEKANDPVSFTFLGPELARLYLKENNAEAKKLIDHSFNEIHFGILHQKKEMEEEGKPGVLKKEKEVLAFERTKPSVEHGGNGKGSRAAKAGKAKKPYDGKYEDYLRNLR